MDANTIVIVFILVWQEFNRDFLTHTRGKCSTFRIRYLHIIIMHMNGENIYLPYKMELLEEGC